MTNFKEVNFFIEGMHCSACSAGIERSLARKSYCKNIEVDLLSKRAKIVFDEAQISLEEIFVFIAKMGYTPSLQTTNIIESGVASINTIGGLNDGKKGVLDSKNTSLFTKLNTLDAKLLPPKIRLILAIVFTIPVLACSLFNMFVGYVVSNIVDSTFMLISALILMHIGRNFYFKGFKALLAKNPTMDSLIALSTGAAFVYSVLLYVYMLIYGVHMHLYFESVCVIICFVMIGKSIENSSKINALQSANLLLSINQKKVLRLKTQNLDKCSQDLIAHDEFEEILAQDIRRGDVIKILPDDLVIVDGVVAQGVACVDESSINGESLPCIKSEGEEILSGSLNLKNVFLLRASVVGEKSMLAQIVTLIQHASDSKSKIQRLADKIASIFVPCVIAIALIAGMSWWGIEDFNKGLEIFISVLVISCPCALGLATPMAFLHARALANKMGIFFKTSLAFETLGKITNIIFDKTGTLTNGLEMQEVLSFTKHYSNTSILSIAKSLELNSSHIIAKAISDSRLGEGINALRVDEFTQMQGLGVSGKIEGITYILGSLESMQDVYNLQEISAKVRDAKSIIYLAKVEQLQAQKRCKIIGAIILSDLARKGIEDMVKYFKEYHIDMMILSGDNEANVRSFSLSIGIEKFKASAKPQDKITFLQKMPHHTTLMVGDGINDAASLKKAGVSMAYASGNSIAQNCADIILYNQNANALIFAHALSLATLRNIKENLFWAFFYNALFIPIACGALGYWGVFLSPSFCALAMSLSSICVVSNATRLRYFRFHKDKKANSSYVNPK